MRSEQIAGWSCSGCKPIRARAHSLRSTERSNTPAAQYPQGGHFVRARHYQNNSRRYIALVKSSVFQTKTQEPELRESTTKYNKTKIYQWEQKTKPRTISGFPRPVVVSPSAKLRLPGRRVRAQKAPGESRYGENGGQKSGCLRTEEKAVGEMFWARIPWAVGGGGREGEGGRERGGEREGGGVHVRACVRACVRVHACVRVRAARAPAV
jgi:hypothetical protein